MFKGEKEGMSNREQGISNDEGLGWRGFLDGSLF
jgi:hypothetical protein